jgi:hypothetical protein
MEYIHRYKFRKLEETRGSIDIGKPLSSAGYNPTGHGIR